MIPYFIQGSKVKLIDTFFFPHIRVTVSKGASDSVPSPYQAIKSKCMCKSIQKCLSYAPTNLSQKISDFLFWARIRTR